jgi:hypothetical protein
MTDRFSINLAVKNLGAPSSDEDEDMTQLEMIEQKLLLHDPTFTIEHTHAALTSRKSALMTAFRPDYGEGHVEGRRFNSHTLFIDSEHGTR